MLEKNCFQDRCTIATNCLPNSPYKDQLVKLHTEILEENVKFRGLLIEFAKSNAWLNFGDCRAYDGEKILTPSELDYLVNELLGHDNPII